MSNTAVCTIVARNYQAFAAALAESLHRFHPDIPLYVLVADELDPDQANGDDLFRRVTLGEIETPGLPQLLFRYDRQQVLIAKKPSLIRHLLDRGNECVVFLDADMLVLDDLTDLFKRVSAHSLSVTPHFCSIEFDPGRFKREHQLLLVGIYNAGFIGATNRPASRRFLAWWDERLHELCESDLKRGLHFDQRWLDMAPAYIGDLYVHRDSDCNVAYWNLPDLDVSVGDSPTRLLLGEKPCKIFHFSGFDPRDPNTVSRFAEDLSAAQRECIAPLLEHYALTLRRLGIEETLQTPWRWNTFSNGIRIPACIRHIFVSLGEAAALFPDPFDASHPKGFYRWLREPVNPDGRGPVPHLSRLWHALYEQHPDIQARFPEPTAADHPAFVEWTSSRGLKRFELPIEFSLTSS